MPKLAKITLAHLRFMLEVKDDPTKRVENLSAFRMKLLLELTERKLMEYESRATVTAFGQMLLNSLEGELERCVAILECGQYGRTNNG